jgi:hypothetical protein
MKYEEARSKIKTGDLIAIKRDSNWFWKLVAWFTKSSYTHTTVAVWLDSDIIPNSGNSGLYCVEMNYSGNYLKPLSQYKEDYDVFEPDVHDFEYNNDYLINLKHHVELTIGYKDDRELDLMLRLEKQSLFILRDKIQYDVIAYLWIFLRLLFSLNIGWNNRKYLCTEICFEIYKKSGWKTPIIFNDVPTTPKELVDLVSSGRDPKVSVNHI